MGGHSSKTDSRHLRVSILRRLVAREAVAGEYVAHGIVYWPGKHIRLKHRRKLIKMIEEESTGVNPFSSLGPASQEDLAQSLLESERPCLPPPLHPVYPFENLVLSGGGMRGYAYIGAAKALEDVGVMPYIKRFAGASAGAMCCSALAIGYSAQDIAKCFYIDLEEIFQDQRCACIACVPKMLTQYGLHPSKRYYETLGVCYKARTGYADLTFKQYHDMTGKEICIVVANVTKLCGEYCHHTTTPDLPIRLAVRMSMAIPFMFEPVKCDTSMSGKKSAESMYVDGCLADRFPIRCFDGNTVGLNPGQPINKKTIGFYLAAEADADHILWDSIFGKTIPKPSYLPDTSMARCQLKEEIKRRKKMRKDFSSQDFLAELHGSRDNLRHYDAPNKTLVANLNLIDVMTHHLEGILNQQVKTMLKPEDEERIIAINTGYIKSHDYNIEPADREFMINQAYDSTERFLIAYKDKHPPILRKESNV